MATAHVSGATRQVNIALVYEDGIAPGDWVVVHAGFALSKMDEQEAADALRLLQDMSDAYAEDMRELASMRQTETENRGSLLTHATRPLAAI